MLFHTLTEIEEDMPQAAPAHPLSDLEKAVPKAQKIKRRVAKPDPAAMVWAGVMVIVFLVASFVAHQMGFTTGETVSLHVTVALISASAGAFLGEKLALEKLLG